jgi:hypothetical protein
LGRYPWVSKLVRETYQSNFKEKKMKKILVVTSVVLVALVIFGAGFFFAQSSQVVSAAGLLQGRGPGGMMGGRGGQGQIHEYVEQAVADKLGMTKADLETQLDGGKSMYQVALDKGIVDTNVTALLTEAHKTALSKAVTDGLLTQAQADTMLTNLTTNGFKNTGCGMNGAGGPDGAGRGGRGGRGGMMGNWNQQPTATQTVAP